MNNLRRAVPFLHSQVAASLLCLLAACGGSSGPPMCQPSMTPQAADSFCAPTRIAANQALRLQIREQCGGCMQSATRCEVTVTGAELKLTLLGNSCTLDPGTACPAICKISTLDCNVPALAPGTYRVTTPAGTSMSVMMTTDLTISATTCTLP